MLTTHPARLTRPTRPTARLPRRRARQGLALVLVMPLLAACANASVLDLKVGDCLQLPTASQATTITSAACTSSHEAEVSALVPTDPQDADAPFPGEQALSAQAETACVDSFEGYVGAPYLSSNLDVTWLTPTQSSWAEGDRTIVCLVHAMDAQTLTSSVKDSGL